MCFYSVFRWTAGIALAASLSTWSTLILVSGYEPEPVGLNKDASLHRYIMILERNIRREGTLCPKRMKRISQ